MVAVRTHERGRYSRFEVLTAVAPAWANDQRGRLYHYDGSRFWQLARKGRVKSVVSWQCPPRGWRHGSACPCGLCTGGGGLDRTAA